MLVNVWTRGTKTRLEVTTSGTKTPSPLTKEEEEEEEESSNLHRHLDLLPCYHKKNMMGR